MQVWAGRSVGPHRVDWSRGTGLLYTHGGELSVRDQWDMESLERRESRLYATRRPLGLIILRTEGAGLDMEGKRWERRPTNLSDVFTSLIKEITRSFSVPL